MRKGFTLIELLAVIVILSVIALIATPLILGVIERTQKSAYEASLRSVFSATELYIATADFNDIPEEGIPIIDENIKLKNRVFTSGKIVKNEQGEIVLQDVSNGVYCGGGTLDNLVVVKGSCYSTDTTPPTDVTIGFGTITSNSIEIVAAAMDVESAISGYEFSIDNGSTWTSKQTSNVYTFSNLINNTEYTFKIRAINNNNLTTESNSLLVSTNDIPLPTYSINTTDWTDSAVVTITYPEREAGYIYEYSLDEGSTWEEVVSPATTKDITFNSNGNVIAKISDGINIVSGVTYEVTNIDTIPPVDPEITYTSPEIPTENTVTITYPGDSVTKEYKNVDDTEWQAYTGPFTVSSNGIIYARCNDNANNWSNTVSYNIDNIVTPTSYSDMTTWSYYSTGGSFTKSDGYVKFDGSSHQRPVTYKSIGNYNHGKVIMTHYDHAKDTYSKNYQSHTIFRYRSSSVSRGSYYNEDSYTDGFDVRMNGDSSAVYIFGYSGGSMVINETFFSSSTHAYQDINMNLEIDFDASAVTIKYGGNTYSVDISSLNYSNFTVAEMGFAGYNPVISNSNIDFKVWN